MQFNTNIQLSAVNTTGPSETSVDWWKKTWVNANEETTVDWWKKTW